jgi:hypothetical protein
MNPGADAAETMFRLVLQGTEVFVKLTGSGAKNLAALLYRYAQGDKRLKGATNLNKLLRSGEELTIVRIDKSELPEFKTLARKYGVLYSAVRDTRVDDGMCDVFFKKKDYAKVEHVVDKMELTGLSHEREPVFNNPKTEYETVIDENGEPQLKKEHQQRNGSDMQKSKSPTRRNPADTPKIVSDIKAGKKEAITPDNWKVFLGINAAMYAYSQNNQDRIFEQSPNASVVLSKTKWRELGRYPQQGAKGIYVTAPEMVDGKHTGNYIDAKVYDISETYGRDIPRHSVELRDGSTAMTAEIMRLEAAAPVPVEIRDDIATDSFYNPDDKKIYLRSDISDSERYIGLIRETQYANAHQKQGKDYDRANTRFTAESVAYSMAAKYGLDMQEFRFDCIPDAINGLDGKDVSELIDPAALASRNEIRKAEKNLEKFKQKQRPSIVADLKAHKKGIENGSYKAKEPSVPMPTPPKGRDRG